MEGILVGDQLEFSKVLEQSPARLLWMAEHPAQDCRMLQYLCHTLNGILIINRNNRHGPDPHSLPGVLPTL